MFSNVCGMVQHKMQERERFISVPVNKCMSHKNTHIQSHVAKLIGLHVYACVCVCVSYTHDVTPDRRRFGSTSPNAGAYS